MKTKYLTIFNKITSIITLWFLFYVFYIIVDLGSMFLVTGDGKGSPITHFMLALDDLVGTALGYDKSSNPILVSAGFYSGIIVFLIKIYKSSMKNRQG